MFGSFANRNVLFACHVVSLCPFPFPFSDRLLALCSLSAPLVRPLWPAYVFPCSVGFLPRMPFPLTALCHFVVRTVPLIAPMNRSTFCHSSSFAPRNSRNERTSGPHDVMDVDDSVLLTIPLIDTIDIDTIAPCQHRVTAHPRPLMNHLHARPTTAVHSVFRLVVVRPMLAAVVRLLAATALS